MRHLLPILALAAPSAAAQPTSLEWARTWGGTAAENANALAIAPDGDVFMAGSFASGVRFGPDSLVSAGSADILLARVSPEGTVRWARRAGSNRADFAYAVENGPNGSVYVGGTFTRSIGFGTGDSLYANGNNRDAFVARYSAAGAFEWAWVGGGLANDDYLRDLLVEPDGSFYAGGDFHTAATIGGQPIRSAGLGDAWIARVRPDRTLAWIRTGGGTSDEDSWRAFAPAPGGGVYAAGTFRAKAFFGDDARPGLDTLVARGNLEMVFARYGADGSLAWVESGGGTASDFAFDATTTTDGDLVAVGILGSTGGTFGAQTATSAGAGDAVAVRLRPDGAVRWVRTAGGLQDDAFRGIAALPGGAVLLVGNLNTPATVGTTVVTTNGGSDLASVRVAADGTFSRAVVTGGGPSFDAASAAAAQGGAAYMFGSFQGAGAVFGGQTFSARGISDLVLVRLLPASITSSEPIQPMDSGAALALVGAHPVRDRATLAVRLGSGASATVTLHDALGRTVARLHDGPLAPDATLDLDVSALAPGVYAVRLISGRVAATRTFVVAR